MKKLVLLTVVVAGCLVLILVLVGKPWSFRSSENSVQAAPSPALDLPALKAKAEHGDAESQFQLGKLYAAGKAGRLDYRQAAEWYQRAADQGNPEGEAALAELYQVGQGVARDPAQAAKLYRSAADQGDAGAQYNLAEIYATGGGLPKDHAQAVKWYRLAADQGNAAAQYNLGQRYDLGVGIAVDRVEAYKWLSLAVAQGVSDNVGARDRVKAKLSHDEAAEASRRIASFVPKPRTPSSPR
jgi:TPR repeat protein